MASGRHWEAVRVSGGSRSSILLGRQGRVAGYGIGKIIRIVEGLVEEFPDPGFLLGFVDVAKVPIDRTQGLEGFVEACRCHDGYLDEGPGG